MPELRLSQAIENFLLACRAEAKSPATRRAYQDWLGLFCKVVGDQAVGQLTEQDVQRYLTTVMQRPGRVAEKVSSSTVHKAYAVVRTFIRYLHRRGLLAECLTDFIKPPRIVESLPETLADQEVEALFDYLAEAGNFRNQVIFELFLDTGLRLGEVAKLDLGDVDLAGSWVRVLGKGRREAVVPFGLRLGRNLHTYIHAVRVAQPGEQGLFTTQRGQRLSQEGLSILVKRAMAATGVKGKQGAHKLRHTFATNFLRNGGSIEALRLILRHRDIKVTQRYVHLLPADVLSAHRQASPLDHRRWQPGF